MSHSAIVLCMGASAASELSQMRRGVIEGCVLVALRDGERYGYDLVRDLSATGLIASDGTIYPLLARLRRQGWVHTVLRASSQGPARQYYSLTDEGRAALETFAQHWTALRNAVESLLSDPGAAIPGDAATTQTHT